VRNDGAFVPRASGDLENPVRRLQLLEKILIDLLDMEGILNSAPDIVADHEHR
jgi:hypothetical protein